MRDITSMDEYRVVTTRSGQRSTIDRFCKAEVSGVSRGGVKPAGFLVDEGLRSDARYRREFGGGK